MREQLLVNKETRTIYLNGTIDEELVHKTHYALASLTGFEPKTILFETEGGDMIDAFAIVDLFRNDPAQIAIHGIGLIASAGMIILAAGGTAGLRKMYKHSMLMNHAVSRVGGKETREQAERENINCQKLETIEKKLFVDNTKLNQEDFNLWKNGSHYYTAKDALTKGIIDGIIT